MEKGTRIGMTKKETPKNRTVPFLQPLPISQGINMADHDEEKKWGEYINVQINRYRN